MPHWFLLVFNQNEQRPSNPPQLQTLGNRKNCQQIPVFYIYNVDSLLVQCTVLSNIQYDRSSNRSPTCPHPPCQVKRNTWGTTKYMELYIVADNTLVSWKQLSAYKHSVVLRTQMRAELHVWHTGTKTMVKQLSHCGRRKLFPAESSALTRRGEST